jgi:hypothetical protein
MEASDSTEQLEALIAHVRGQLSMLSGGDGALEFELRKRLVAVITFADKEAARHRRALNARKFAAQHGRCASCGARLSPHVFRRPRPAASSDPIICASCYAARKVDA